MSDWHASRPFFALLEKIKTSFLLVKVENYYHNSTQVSILVDNNAEQTPSLVMTTKRCMQLEQVVTVAGTPGCGHKCFSLTYM